MAQLSGSGWLYEVVLGWRVPHSTTSSRCHVFGICLLFAATRRGRVPGGVGVLSKLDEYAGWGGKT